MGSEWWWLSCRNFTVAVRCVDGRVVEGPPIVGKFVKTEVRKLRNWMRGIGRYKEQRL